VSTVEVVDEPVHVLTELDVRVLAFERRQWRRQDAKAQAIKAEFDLSATEYYQLLQRVIDNPAALAAEPVLINRLRRLRAERARARSRAAR
jgi:hypothetical protein